MPASPWVDRVWHEFRAGNLTRTARDVLLTLHSYRGCGEIRPSHRTLAERCKCSVRSVQRALQAGRSLGLVDWCERRVRAAWRWLRASNAYRLMVPATTGQSVRGREREEKQRRCEKGVSVADTLHRAVLERIRLARLKTLGLAAV